MYSMVIVDDEYYNREGMKKFIDWQKYGIEIIGSAENGILGVELIKDLQPDIVLTDIRMKAMDGLAMIEEIRKTDIHCKFIIMSGYKVFEYAKKAMEEGVEFYLLKPINKNQLIDALEKIKQMLDKSCQDTHIQKLYQSEHFIRNLMNDKYLQGNDTINSYYFCKINLKEHMPNFQQDKLDVYHMLLTITENFHICFFDDREIVLMLYNEINIKSVLRKMYSSLGLKFNGEINVGVSDEFNFLTDFQAAKQQSDLALQYRLYDSRDEKLLFYNHFSDYINKIDDKLIKISKEITRAIEICDKQILSLEISKAYNEIIWGKYIPAQVYDWFKHLHMNIINIMKTFGFSESEILSDGNNNVYQIDVDRNLMLSDIAKNTENFCVSCIQMIENNRGTSSSKNILNVITYIDNHYMEDISLEYLGKVFYMELSYLSKLFKKETNESYLSYITKKRIQKAKELMGNTNLTIYEISEKVSYTDPKYFSLLFKKTEGISPAQYRAELLKK